ncbi:zf-C3HC-domain-containing protein [Calocera viscosa TUFC12733]|uniref:Zf-C3HC-domain-containing protein n=1 Tax=Calocera viscosa (strain TUFC12733) TaxID=1330018 RepID=A0A167R322_CALVF|nr:zf-C3HC-domain-containing protein [Calocera viscosa TUFC12733]
MEASTSTAAAPEGGQVAQNIIQPPLSASYGPQYDRALYFKAMRNLDTLASWDPSLPNGGVDMLPSLQSQVKTILPSTLAKYGVFEKRKPHKRDPLASAPKLKALLEKQRARERARNALPEPVLPDVPYRPYSYDDFMRRLSTFKLFTYREQREGLDPPSVARCGWVNDGKNRLRCEWCKETWVVQGEKSQSREEAEVLYAKQKQLLIDSHRASCPWRILQCDPSIYQIQMHSREKFVKEAIERAIMITPLVDGLQLAYPVSERDSSTILEWFHKLSPPVTEANGQPQPQYYSDTAAILGLFGWTASTLDAPMARGPRKSWPSRPQSTIVAATNTPPRPSTPASRATPSSSKPVIQCVLCHAKIGLWSFPRKTTLPPTSDGMDVEASPAPDSPGLLRRSTPRRDTTKLDPIREHQPYCPYVSRKVPKSAYTIALPFNGPEKEPDELVEGWKAIIYVMTRKTSAERSEERRQARLRAERGETDATEEREKDDIDMVIDYVEQHGGRELTRYVSKLIK